MRVSATTVVVTLFKSVTGGLYWSLPPHFTTIGCDAAGRRIRQGRNMARPTKLKQEYIEQAAKLAKLGLTYEEMADFFKVDRVTFWRWRVSNDAFCNAIKVEADKANDRIKESLFKRATGFMKTADRIIYVNGKPKTVEVREEVAPDTAAARFWLANRDPENWKFAPEFNVDLVAEPMNIQIGVIDASVPEVQPEDQDEPEELDESDPDYGL